MTASDIILQDMAELMKCDDCGYYLRPPIHNIADDRTICDFCEDKHSILGRNKLLESIGSVLKFPCLYQSFGCKLTVTWEEAKQHNTECPFRQFDCPRCDWKGNSLEMVKHVKTKHGYMDANCRFALTQNEGSYFMYNMQELYILFYKCDTDAGLLWYTVKCVGPNEIAKRRHFKLSLKHEGNVYFERKQAEVPKSWDIDEDTAIKIDLCILRMKLQMKSESVTELNVEVFSRTPLYNGSVDEGLLRDVECPVCHDYMMAPIYQCVVGHSLCNACKPKMKTCPMCKNNMGESRNYSLESVCSKMYYKCMYADDGCDFASLPEDIIQHENDCKFGFCDCPLKTFIGCEWQGKLDQMSSHALDEHGLKM